MLVSINSVILDMLDNVNINDDIKHVIENCSYDDIAYEASVLLKKEIEYAQDGEHFIIK